MTRVRLALALAAIFQGCASGRIPHLPGDPPPAVSDLASERAYQDTLSRFTDSQAIYDQLDTKVFFRATWQSPAFVEARLQREGDFKGWPAKVLELKRSQERARLDDATEFFLAVHTTDYRFEDFERESSLWRVSLAIDGDELTPVSMQRLGRSSLELRSTYSYLETFWVAYVVRFPKRTIAPGTSLELRLASALGKAQLHFTAD